MTKKAIYLVLAPVLIAATFFGIRYYYDYVKLPDRSPTQVVQAYFEAVLDKDYERAFAMVSRKHYPDSFNQFKDRVDMYAPDMRLDIVGESITGDVAVVDAKVSVPMSFGEYTSETRMTMARLKREWRIIHP